MIGLLCQRGAYAVDHLVASGLLPLGIVDTLILGIPNTPSPYALPAISEGDAVVVVSSWLHAAASQEMDSPEKIIELLRTRFSRIIGLDHADPFQLDFPDTVMDHMDAVLKVNGVYRDPGLYDFVVGAPTPDGRWTEKTQSRGAPFRRTNLEKLHLSLPCFWGVSPRQRARVRGFYQKSLIRRKGLEFGDRMLDRLPGPLTERQPPRCTVNFFASLTHMQRATALRMLRRSSLQWKGGISRIPEYITGFRGDGMARLTPEEQEDLAALLGGEQLMTAPLSRPRYQLAMRDCKAVLSITGYGELCFRIAEAWANRRILVCQDLSHVETLVPVTGGRNAVFCRPDLGDMIEILEDIECNYRNYLGIAEQGYQDWRDWTRREDEVMEHAFAPLLPSWSPSGSLMSHKAQA